MLAPVTSTASARWKLRIGTSSAQIAQFCKKWNVTELAAFGSVLRDDFRADSDIDILITFDPAAPWDLFHLVDMRDELAGLFGRAVDLVEKKAIRNPFRRHHVLNHCEVIYAA